MNSSISNAPTPHGKPNTSFRRRLTAALLGGCCAAGNLLGADGALDPSFNPGKGANPTGVGSILVQRDGKILLGGNFNEYDAVARKSIARANENGSNDSTFFPGTGLDLAPAVMLEQGNGKIILVGEFESYNGFTRKSLARVNPNGSLDLSYNPGARYSPRTRLLSAALLPNGKLLVGSGDKFTSTGSRLPALERFNSDGTLDRTFSMVDPSSISLVEAILVQPDGRILVAGTFNEAGQPLNSIRRLNANGSLDSTFFSGATESGGGGIHAAALQPDGRIIIAGSFTSYRGTPRNRIARLNSDGSLDKTFNPGTGVTVNGQSGGNLVSISLQLDGKIVIAGSFDRYNGIPRLYLTRVNPNGSLDKTFQTGTGPDDVVIKTALQPNGRILIGGFFFNYDGVRRDSIARLLSAPPPLAFQAELERIIDVDASGYARLLDDEEATVSDRLTSEVEIGKADFAALGITAGDGFADEVVELRIMRDGSELFSRRLLFAAKRPDSIVFRTDVRGIEAPEVRGGDVARVIVNDRLTLRGTFRRDL